MSSKGGDGSESSSFVEEKKEEENVMKPNAPAEGALYQQTMNAWSPILHPVWVIVTLLIFGVIFVASGVALKKISDNVVELVQTYDASPDNEDYESIVGDCQITTANANKQCTLTFVAPENMEAPVLVYYQIKNFHQNHKDYITSVSALQLGGKDIAGKKMEKDNCKPLYQLGDITLNPCGFIANTFFNDVITLSSGNDSNGQKLQMLENGIAWSSDLEFLYDQPEGFRKEKCSDADNCQCDDGSWSCTTPYQDDNGDYWLYSYPEDDRTQYLHETYPGSISPLEGVTNEHFVVWMRVAAQPEFRKLYGYMDKSISKGETLTFTVDANWIVHTFQGSKSLVLTTTSMFGGKNPNVGNVFIGVGIFCLSAGVLFGLKHWIKPRKLGDEKYLKYKNE